MSEDLNKLRELAEAATPGPWHHCQPFMVVPAQKTVHGTVPAERVDYVSTWPDRGTPPGHRVVVPMPPECGPGVRSADMAFIAAANPAKVLSLLAENEKLRTREADLIEALTPSADTKAAYIGEIKFSVCQGMDDDGCEIWGDVTIPWDATKATMAMIAKYAALVNGEGGE